MRRDPRIRLGWLLVSSLLVLGCEPADGGAGAEDDGVNPFTEEIRLAGKTDTAYQNPDGIEVEVDLEADVEATSYRLAQAPAVLGQFASTWLRKRGEFYLESLAEDASSRDRVEWLVDGTWITAAAANDVSSEKLRRFRIRGVNAVLLFEAADGVAAGKVFTARVPLRPYDVMTEAGDTCADPDGHMTLSSSIYWYLWNPERRGCQVATQDMTVTVARVLPAERPTYPEYDQLVADGKVTAVVLFGQIGDDPLTDDDTGVRGMARMARWLTQGGYTEVTPAPVGRRFTKRIADVDFEIDLYSPYDFAGLSDMAHYDNFRRAIEEHEIVAYDGHSMLGASDFWARPKYPDTYQIFLYGGCLGYEYYVAPILDGKGGWDKVDILSSVVEVSADATRFAAPVLARIAWALDNGYKATWSDLLEAVRESVGDSTFGVSGVRDNCFSPGGDLCSGGGGGGEARRHEATPAADIPDMDADGVTSMITVAEGGATGRVTVELDIAHTYVGDLRVTLAHGGVEAVLWEQAGGRGEGLHESVTTDAFAGQDAAGDWVLRVADVAAQDTGTLERWALVLAP